MAVVGGGSAGGKVLMDAVVPNTADRVLYLQEHVGDHQTWLPDSGLVKDRRASFDEARVDVDPNAAQDGETYGVDNRLTSASNLFRSDMVGKKIVIDGIQRTITVFTNAGEVEYSGNPLPAQTNREYTVDGGVLAGDRSISSGGQILNSRAVPAADGRVLLRWSFTS